MENNYVSVYKIIVEKFSQIGHNGTIHFSVAKEERVVTLRNATRVTPDGMRENVESAIISEFSVDLYVNDEQRIKLVCTPTHIMELAVGRLISEGYITCTDEIESAYMDEKGENVSFRISKTDAPLKEEYVVMEDAFYETEWIFRMIDAFTKEGQLHKKTKAAHSCILGRKGEVLFQCEDIGRHNAMDKAIGYMYLNKIKPQECMLFTSGRVPTEMAHKAIMAGIPVLISKAVPTDRALKMAQQYNMKLICKAWPDSFEIFN